MSLSVNPISPPITLDFSLYFPFPFYPSASLCAFLSSVCAVGTGWVAPNGRVLLLGDAGHAAQPWIGQARHCSISLTLQNSQTANNLKFQGANMALIDAAVVARVLHDCIFAKEGSTNTVVMHRALRVRRSDV